MFQCCDCPQGLYSKETVSCLFCGKRDNITLDIEVRNDMDGTVVALDRRKADCYVQTNEPLGTLGQD